MKHTCHWFIQLQGANPNTGQPVDEWGCAIAWLPILLIEGSQQTRQAGAAIESFRNEMMKPNPGLLAIAAQIRDRQTHETTLLPQPR